jgi:hypothetical protein
MQKLETELNRRILRFDGVSVVEPVEVPSLLAAGIPPSRIRVSAVDLDVDLFNDRVDSKDRLLLDRQEPIKISYDWNIPADYLYLDLSERIFGDYLLKTDALSYTEEQKVAALERIEKELIELEKRGMQDFFRTIIYVLDTFRKNNIVWGVGRGSSCACYILFILGLHTVDCIRYDIPMSEFFHD